MTTRTVFDGGHLRASLSLPAAATRRLLVTFDFRKPGRRDFSPPARSESLLASGVAQLSVRTRANDWFVNPDTRALEAALPAIVAAFDEVRTLGFSMGGYGAFRFAGALGAVSVLAISPQVSLAPAVAPFETRYGPEARGFDPKSGAMTGGPGLTGLILVDPFVAADLCHARALTALFPDVRILRLGFAGHPAHGLLAESQRIGLLQRSAASGPKPGPLHAAHRAARRQSAGYWGRLALRAVTRRPALAARALAQAARLAPAGIPAGTRPADAVGARWPLDAGGESS